MSIIDQDRLTQEALQLGITVKPELAAQLDRYMQLLLDANRTMNLTRITEPREMEVKHLLDCLAVTAIPGLKGEVLDIGTGAGMPGIVIALSAPDCQVTMMDSTAKKLRFVQSVCEYLSIPAKTILARAEEYAFGELGDSFDAVVARAVAPLPQLVEIALPFVKKGGILIAMKALLAADEISKAQPYILKLGGKVVDSYDYLLPGDMHRKAVIIEKISQTPPNYYRKGANPVKNTARKH